MKNERCPICFKEGRKDGVQPCYDLQTKLSYCSAGCLDTGRILDLAERALADQCAIYAQHLFEKFDASMRQILAEEEK